MDHVNSVSHGDAFPHRRTDQPANADNCREAQVPDMLLSNLIISKLVRKFAPPCTLSTGAGPTVGSQSRDSVLKSLLYSVIMYMMVLIPNKKLSSIMFAQTKRQKKTLGRGYTSVSQSPGVGGFNVDAMCRMCMSTNLMERRKTTFVSKVCPSIL